MAGEVEREALLVCPSWVRGKKKWKDVRGKKVTPRTVRAFQRHASIDDPSPKNRQPKGFVHCPRSEPLECTKKKCNFYHES